jgi:glycosyltransferase involved in cell wall biosynthesis
VSLKLIWAGPWNERSAIGFFGTEIVRELVSLGHHVEVLRTETGADALLPSRPALVPIHAADGWSAGLADAYDGVIVNLGNHYGFHGAAIPLLRETASLVILHDAWMGHFIDGWRHAAGEDAWRVDRLVSGLGQDPSGIGALSALAFGAVVHGPHYLKAVEAACPGPVAYFPLSYASKPLPPARLLGEGVAGDRLVVTTIGHVNRNKRVDEVIRAIGGSERLRERVFYMLVGPVEPDEQTRLLALAQHVGAPAPHFTGWVPDEVLLMLMVGTDVFSCLRYPALEGGSASLITAMLSGRPTLVSDHAGYAEVPEELVMKCAAGEEAAYVMHHLETVMDHPAAARAMGERAREYARRTFAPAAYAEKLLETLDRATRAAPSIRASRAVGRKLAEIGIRSGDPALERMEMALAGLLRGTEQQQ